MINFELKNIDEFVAELNTSLATQESKLKKIAELIQYHIELNLMGGQSYLGGSVAPLRPSTIKRKGSNRIFYDTGVLVHSVELKHNSLNDFQIQIAEQRKDIATYLQLGTKRMVARPFFGVNTSILPEIDKILADG